MQTCTYFIILVSFVLAAGGPGCSSVFQVKSDPLQSDVSFLDAKTGVKKPLGKTPFEMPASSLKQAMGDEPGPSEYFTLLVEHPGYNSERVLVPATRFGTMITQLDVKLKSGNQEKEAKTAKDVLDHLFLAQKYAILKQFERAQAELDRILTEFPTFSRALSMRGSIYFLQKNYSESLKWYAEALKNDAQMEDALKMTAKIQTLIGGGRLPSSQGTGATGKGKKP